MERKYKITIPEPCQEDWNKMTPNDNGRFCGSCSKSVVDFTNKKTTEIEEYLFRNKEQNICGRFRNEQVNKFNIQIPQSVLKQKMSFQKAFFLALFVVMGTSLFSCKNHNDATLGEVSVVEDTVQTQHAKGMILPAKDTIECSETMTVGKIDMERYDSLVKAGVKMCPLPPPPPPKVDQIKFVKPRKQDSLIHRTSMGEISADSLKIKKK